MPRKHTTSPERISPYFVKREKIEQLWDWREWKKSGRHVRWGRELSDVAGGAVITKSYISQVLSQKIPVSAFWHCVIKKWAALDQEPDSVLFDIRLPQLSPNHPAFNNEKYEGRVAYCKRSVAALHRRIDDPKVEERKDLPTKQ